MRNAASLNRRIYLRALGFGSPVTLCTGQFVSLQREIKLSS